jgi:general secretion pathway protein C
VTGLWRTPVHAGHAVLLLLALLVVALGVRAVESVRAPVKAFPKVVDPVVADRDLLARSDPFFAATPMGEDLPVTSLPLSLHGVRADTVTGRGTAIIALADGQQGVFLVGDTLTDGVRLVQVAIDHVVIEREGLREALWMTSDGGTAVPSAIPADPMLLSGVAGPAAGAAPPQEVDDSQHFGSDEGTTGRPN